MKQKLFGVVLFLCMIGAVICHAGVQAEVLKAGERCVRVLIPSLYFFSILAACCVRSGLLCRISAGKKLWSMDGYLLTVVIFSQLGGYPVGAQLLHAMRMNGTIPAEQERRLLCICMGCGPGFLLGTVCNRLSPGLAAWVMLSVCLPNLLLAWFLTKGETVPGAGKCSGVRLLTESVESAASAMLKIAGMVMGMAAVLGILEETGLFGLLGGFTSVPERTVSFLKTIAEVSCVTEFLQNGGSLPAAAALLSFGGICVHLQAAAICEGNLSWLRFWGIRALCSVMTYAICLSGIRLLFPDAVPTSLMMQQQAAVCGGSVLPGICLLVMSVLLLKRQSRI